MQILSYHFAQLPQAAGYMGGNAYPLHCQPPATKSRPVLETQLKPLPLLQLMSSGHDMNSYPIHADLHPSPIRSLP